jgi:VRR-NUC domain
VTQTALQILTELDYAAKRAAHPTVPYLPKTKFTDRTSNALTKCVVRCFELHGHYASRIASTGTYRADLKRFVHSQQKAGQPDVMAIVKTGKHTGQYVGIEIKVGKDRLSDVQKQTIARLEKSGAMVFVAKDYSSFWEWFKAHFLPFDEAEHLPFGPLPSHR